MAPEVLEMGMFSMNTNSILLSLLWMTLAVCATPAQEVLKGQIDGALYEISVPLESNGRLLLLAHGYRPESAELDPEFGSSHSLFEDLARDGWTVAASSYRRNGWILEDAAADLIALRGYITKNVAAYERVYLAGNSMGGGIITWIAEHEPEGFDGALAMGAYLFEPIASESERLTELADYYGGSPQFPILYLTNISEVEGPEAYIALAEDASPKPVLWRVDRAGHVNLNYAEQAAGLNGLVDWVESGSIDPTKNGTVVMQPESTAEFSDGVAVGGVHALVPVYGNVVTSFVASDLKELGIEIGERFSLTAEGETVTVLMGTDYGDVAVGDWVAFWNADGYLLVCRNYRDAVGSLGLNEASFLSIRP